MWVIAAVSKSVLTAIKKKEKTGVNSLGRRPKTNTIVKHIKNYLILQLTFKTIMERYHKRLSHVLVIYWFLNKSKLSLRDVCSWDKTVLEIYTNSTFKNCYRCFQQDSMFVKKWILINSICKVVLGLLNAGRTESNL